MLDFDQREEEEGAPASHRMGAQIPVCGSLEETHQAKCCEPCQNIYRARRRVRRAAARTPRAAACGAQTRGHRAAQCNRCIALKNATYYSKHKERTQTRRRNRPPEIAKLQGEPARIRARLWANLRRGKIVAPPCPCGAAIDALVIDPTAPHRYVFCCQRHRKEAAQFLGIYAAGYDSDIPLAETLGFTLLRSQTGPTVGSRYERAQQLARRLPDDVLGRIRARAGQGVLGVPVSESSPLYRSMFAQLVDAAIAQLDAQRT